MQALGLSTWVESVQTNENFPGPRSPDRVHRFQQSSKIFRYLVGPKNLSLQSEYRSPSPKPTDSKLLKSPRGRRMFATGRVARVAPETLAAPVMIEPGFEG